MIVTLATLANWALVASSISWPTLSEIGAKLCVSLLTGLVLISLQYRSAISGTYSNRTTVEEATSTILEVAADVRQSPDVIRDKGRISEFTTAVHQIIDELEEAPLSDEQQLQVCMKEWIAKFQNAIPDRQEKFITGEERSGDDSRTPWSNHSSSRGNNQDTYRLILYLSKLPTFFKLHDDIQNDVCVRLRILL